MLKINLPVKNYEVQQRKVASTKESVVAFRELGYSLKDCALLSGISTSTLTRYQEDDSEFVTAIQAAWAKYQGRLIKKMEDKDPKYLLQTDFPERFKKDKDEAQTQIAAFIGYDQLAERLANLLSGNVQGSNPGTPTREIEGSTS